MTTDLALEKKLLENTKLDKSQFGEIYKYFVNDVYRFSFSLLQNKHDAEDITSKVFEKFYQKIDDYEWQNKSLKSWLFATSKFLIFNLRKTSSKVEIDDELICDEPDIICTENIAINRSLLELIKKEINKLDLIERSIINLRIWEELSFKEIAEILESTETACRKRFYRSIEKIKKNVEKKDKKIVYPVLFSYVREIKNEDENKINPRFLNGELKKYKNMDKILTIAKIFISTLTGKLVIGGIVSLIIISSAGTFFIIKNNKDNKKREDDKKSAQVSEEEKNKPTPTSTPTITITETPIPTLTATPTATPTVAPTAIVTTKPTVVVTAVPTVNPYKTYTSATKGVSFQYPVGATVTETSGYCSNNINITFSTSRNITIFFDSANICSATGTYSCTAISSSPVTMSNGKVTYRTIISYDQFPNQTRGIAYFDSIHTNFACNSVDQLKFPKMIFNIMGTTNIANDNAFNIVLSTLK